MTRKPIRISDPDPLRYEVLSLGCITVLPARGDQAGRELHPQGSGGLALGWDKKQPSLTPDPALSATSAVPRRHASRRVCPQ